MLALLTLGAALAQDLGHKLPGNLGLDAGRAAQPGAYLADRVLYYAAREVRDRNGDVVSSDDFRLDAVANGVGLSGTVELGATRVTGSFAVPVAWASVDGGEVEARIDRLGLADLYVEPIRLSWHEGPFDGVASYALYVPTGLSALAGGTGPSLGHITHQASLGGTAYFGNGLLTALVSYDHHLRSREIDLTRGATLQIVGGAGFGVGELVEIGLAGAALWQVTDDEGADVPSRLAGARDRTFGLGPEVAVRIPGARAVVRTRYERDLGVRSRPDGHLFVLGIVFALTSPPNPADDVGRNRS